MSDLPDASEPGGTVTNTCARCGRIYDPEKPHDCADRTAFTHGMDRFYDPAIIPTAVPDSHTVIDGKLWRVIPSGFGYDDGSQSCRLVSLDERHDPEWPEHIASMEREAVDHLRAQRDHYRLSLREIADTSEDEATVRFAMRSLEGQTQITALVPIEDQPPAEAGHERCDLSTCRICDAVTADCIRDLARLRSAPSLSPTVDDLEAYIDLALIRWVPGDDAGLARHIAESIHPRLVPVSPSVDPEEEP